MIIRNAVEIFIIDSRWFFYVVIQNKNRLKATFTTDIQLFVLNLLKNYHIQFSLIIYNAFYVVRYMYVTYSIMIRKYWKKKHMSYWRNN